MADEARCACCGRSSEEVPLIRLTYQQADMWLCPEEMPKLIHNPSALAIRFGPGGGG